MRKFYLWAWSAWFFADYEYTGSHPDDDQMARRPQPAPRKQARA